MQLRNIEHHTFNTVVATVLALAFALACSFDLTTYPLVSDDEVMLNDPARALVIEGKFRSSVFAGGAEFDRIYLFQPPGQTLIVSGVYALFGFGIEQTRLTGIIFGAVCVFLLVQFTFQLFKSIFASAVSGGILALNTPFVLTAKLGRHDVFSIAFLLSACILFLQFVKTRKASRAYWSALCTGLAGICHPIALSYFVGFFLYMLFAYQEDLRVRLRRVLLFCFVCGVPLFFWLAYIIANDSLDAFYQQFLLTGTNRSAAQLGLFERIVGEIYLQVYAHRRILTLLVANIAGFLWILRAIRQDRSQSLLFLFILLCGSYVFNTFVMGKASGFYFVYPNLLATVCFSRLASIGFARSGFRSWCFWFLILLFFNLSVFTFGPRLLAHFYQKPERNYSFLVEEMANLELKGKVVFEGPGYWYAVHQHGGTLQLGFLDFVKADPHKHHYLFSRPDSQPKDPGFDEIARFGKPLRPVLGSILSDRSYEVVVYKSRYFRENQRDSIESNTSTLP